MYLKSNKTKVRGSFLSLLFSVLTLSATFSFAGGKDGGGGNMAPIPRPSTSELRNILMQIQLPTKAALNSFTNAKYADVRLQSLQRLLLLGSDEKNPKVGRKNIFWYIDHVTLKPQEVGPCHDHKNKVKDASVDLEHLSICFSLERISANKEIDIKNYKLKLLALAAHEYSHFVGTTDPEDGIGKNSAKLLEDTLISRIHPGFDVVLKSWKTNFLSRLNYFQILLQSYESELNKHILTSKDFLQDYNEKQYRLIRELMDVDNELDNTGIQPLDPYHMAQFASLYIRNGEMTSVTVNWSNGAEDIFGGFEQMDLNTYAHKTGINLEFEGIIHKAHYLDYNHYAQEIKLCSQSVAVLIEFVKKVPDLTASNKGSIK